MSTPSITIELYNKLVPDYPLQGSGEWDDVIKYVNNIHHEMRRNGWGLGDCHYYNLSQWYHQYIEYGPDQNETSLNIPRGRELKRAIDSFATQLYDLKLIG